MTKASFAGAALAMWLASGSAAAIDGISVTGGIGAGSSEGEGTRLARLAVQWDWNKRWFEGDNWHLGGYWNADVAYWKRDALPGQNGHLYEIGFTPVFRLQQSDLEGFYLEGGVGAFLLSETSLGDRDFSTSFQFGSQFGFGYRFGAKHAFDVSYVYQHVSNAGIKKPNDGMDFHEVRLQYHF